MMKLFKLFVLSFMISGILMLLMRTQMIGISPRPTTDLQITLNQSEREGHQALVESLVLRRELAYEATSEWVESSFGYREGLSRQVSLLERVFSRPTGISSDQEREQGIVDNHKLELIINLLTEWSDSELITLLNEIDLKSNPLVRAIEIQRARRLVLEMASSSRRRFSYSLSALPTHTMISAEVVAALSITTLVSIKNQTLIRFAALKLGVFTSGLIITWVGMNWLDSWLNQEETKRRVFREIDQLLLQLNDRLHAPINPLEWREMPQDLPSEIRAIDLATPPR